MHWTPEHAQCPEQYLDISFTTSSPAHKTEGNRLNRQRHQYAWANDDISALTASNLLKKYAEKYSGIVNSSYERSELNTYADGAFGPVNGQKNENDTWEMPLSADGTYSVNSIHDSLSGSKEGTNSTLPPGNGTVGIGGSSVVTNSHSEPRYPSNTCGPTTASSIQSSLAPVGTSQEYSSGYNGTYLSSGYCSQTTSAVPSSHPSLNNSSLLQPVHPTPTIVPSYSSTLAGASPLYNYPSNSYHSQSSIGPGYAGVHLPSSYLPSGIPTPILLPPSTRPSIVPSYGYQSHNLNPSSVSPVSNGSSSSLKRKAFDITAEEEEGNSRYRRYSYGQQRTTSGSYQMSDDVIPDDCRGNGFSRNDETLPVEFKAGKQHIVDDLIVKYSGQEKKGMMSQPYSSEERPLRSRSTEAFVKFTPALINGERGDDHGHILSHQMQVQRVEPATTSNQLEEQLKNLDSQLLNLVTNEIVDCGPPVQWDDIAGLDTAKAVIEEQVLWPLMRPGAYSGVNGPPKSILLFGPHGGGKTMLTRCIATHLGATFLKVSGSSFISKWKGDGEMILQAMFLIARSRQPSVIFINELDAMLSIPAGEESIHLNSIKAKLLSHVEGVVNSSSDHIIVIGGTRHPDDIEETIHRYFVKRLYISPPDSIARQQILICTLSQQDHCLSDAEISLIVQHTEGYSGSDLMQLCQEAALGQGHGLTAQLQPATYKDFENAFSKVRPSVSQKELKLYTEWSKLFGSCVQSPAVVVRAHGNQNRRSILLMCSACPECGQGEKGEYRSYESPLSTILMEGHLHARGGLRDICRGVLPESGKKSLVVIHGGLPLHGNVDSFKAASKNSDERSST
ncbi:fidgetin-like [Heptranchias perlo]|uniref:fidgetin-like n=1 Tax=Heptranchias perlo TaxID=212740 RepID=UPI00355A80D6